MTGLLRFIDSMVSICDHFVLLFWASSGTHTLADANGKEGLSTTLKVESKDGERERRAGIFYMSTLLEFGGLGKEGYKFKPSLSYTSHPTNPQKRRDTISPLWG